MFLFSIVEGISEWLPISSSGHLLLLDELIKLDASDNFKEVFFVIIQLGAIFAVFIYFFNKLNPFDLKNRSIKKDVVSMWKKVILACIPGGIIALLFDDYVDKYLDRPIIISLMLILYGVIFIIIEKFNKNRESKREISYKDALLIGLFQTLSIIPGTSRSGTTIVGGLLLGIDRVSVSQFSFFISIPAMVGLSFIELMDFGLAFSSIEVSLLLIGAIMAFIVSLMVIRFLMKYIQNHDFKIFGYYRIIFGILFICYFIKMF